MSVSVTVHVGAVGRLLDRGGDIDRDMERRARRVEATAKVLAPVDTGRMRASGYTTQATEIPAAWDVIFPVHYAIFVNSGTRFMAARPFMTDALPAAL